MAKFGNFLKSFESSSWAKPKGGQAKDLAERIQYGKVFDMPALGAPRIVSGKLIVSKLTTTAKSTTGPKDGK